MGKTNRNQRKNTPINPLNPIKLRLREAVERLGLNDAMEAGVDLPDEEGLFALGIHWHVRWLEDNAKHGTDRAQIISLARLFRLYPAEVRFIVEALKINGVVEDEPIQYAIAELIFRALGTMDECKAGVKRLQQAVEE